MSRSSSCWRHPAKSVVGVCASCLRERLSELATAEERHVSPQRCSFDSNASPPEAAEGNVVTVSKLMEADQVEADYRSGLEAIRESQDEPRRPPVLQRTHSWSHQGSRQRNGAYGAVDLGKAARILSSKENSLLYSEESLPGCFMNSTSTKFDSGDTPKGHTKASSWPEIDSQRRQQQQQQQQRKGSSWLWSLLGIRNKQSKEPISIGSPSSSEKAKRTLFGLGRKKKAEPPPDPFADILSSPWQSGKLDKPETDELSETEQQQQQQQQRTRASRNEQSYGLTNRVTPLSGNGDLLASSSSASKLSKMSSVNGSRHYGRRHRDGWSKALSTPLRVFGKAGQSKKSRDELDLESEDRAYSWYASSPKRFHPSPAFPTSASYTTYYRDYGASWSLHSSPMPGKGRHHHRGGGGSSSRPWENRDVFHAHPSPFRAAGSNTWNFYLTPLRPVRTSTSRHRP